MYRLTRGIEEDEEDGGTQSMCPRRLMIVKEGHMEEHQMAKGDIEGQAGTTELE